MSIIDHIEDFPTLKDDQVALLRAERATGHVLDEQFNLAINVSQTVYTVFNNLDEALNVSKDILSARKNLECVIYAKDKNVLLYINPQNIDSL